MIPAMSDHDPDEYLPVEAAGNVAGISPRTLRYWVRGGKLSAIEGQRGKLVRLGDVLALADLTGKSATLPATGRQVLGTAGNLATSAVGNAGNAAMSVEPDADSGEHTVPAGAVSPEARSQLEAIRDEWLRPLIDRNEELARENGRLQAERDAMAERLAEDRKLADVLQAERDDAERERARLAEELAEVASRDAAARRDAEERARALQVERDRLTAQVETLNIAWRSASAKETTPYKEPWWRFWERWW